MARLGNTSSGSTGDTTGVACRCRQGTCILDGRGILMVIGCLAYVQAWCPQRCDGVRNEGGERRRRCFYFTG